MSKKYNAEFDTRVAQEFSGKDSYVGGKLSTPLKVFLWILAIVGFIGGFASCTQYFASELSYSPYLGTPVFNIGNVYFYYPWEIFFWSDAREACPELTDNLISMYYVGSAPFWVLAITIKIFNVIAFIIYKDKKTEENVKEALAGKYSDTDIKVEVEKPNTKATGIVANVDGHAEPNHITYMNIQPDNSDFE